MRWILLPTAMHALVLIVCSAVLISIMTLLIIASPDLGVHIVAWLMIVVVAICIVQIGFPGIGRWGAKLRRGWFSGAFDASAREVEFGPGFVTIEYVEAGEPKQVTVQGTVLRFQWRFLR